MHVCVCVCNGETQSVFHTHIFTKLQSIEVCSHHAREGPQVIPNPHPKGLEEIMFLLIENCYGSSGHVSAPLQNCIWLIKAGMYHYQSISFVYCEYTTLLYLEHVGVFQICILQLAKGAH